VIYVLEDEGRNRVKIGYAAVVDRRNRQHWTSNPSLKELVRFPGTQKDEKELHKRFADDRQRGEFFVMSGAVARWVEEMIREHGSSEAIERRETARQWLMRVSKKGRGRHVREAAARDLRTWETLTETVPASARGGWTLWERLAGKTGRSEPGTLPILRDEPVLSGVHYRGEVFVFHCWVEACERYGDKAPSNAIRAGVRPSSHSVKTNRRIGYRRWRTESLVVTDDVASLFPTLEARR
jgi:hypothetical protein